MGGIITSSIQHINEISAAGKKNDEIYNSIKAFVIFAVEKQEREFRFLFFANNPEVKDCFLRYLQTCPAYITEVAKIRKSGVILEEFQLSYDFGGSDVLTNIADTMIPQFLMSSHFDNWYNNKYLESSATADRARICSTTIPEIVSFELSSIPNCNFVTAKATLPEKSDQIPCNSVQVLLESESVASVRPNGFEKEVYASPIGGIGHSSDCENVINIMDPFEMSAILKCDPWLFSFMVLAENLPISISISTACRSRVGFPLIYVNRHFEKMTGYSRVEIIGGKCSFLQRNESEVRDCEQESLDRFVECLSKAMPALVKITNYRRNGTKFRNFVAIKPLFDSIGEYRYVLGCQVDLTNFESKKSSFPRTVADSAMKLIPNFV